MKFPLLLILIWCLSVIDLRAQSAQQFSSEGQRAYLSNDMETAKARFQQALALDPSNQTATGYLRMIMAQEKKAGGPGGGELEKQLRALVLPEVKFKEATFAEALEYLKQMAAKQSVAVSIVVQPDVNREAKVTLNLANVPFTEALRYVCELVGTKYSIDRFAVVVKKA